MEHNCDNDIKKITLLVATKRRVLKHK